MGTLFLVLYIIGVIIAFIIDFAKFYKEEKTVMIYDVFGCFVFSGLLWPLLIINDVGNIKIKK